MSSNHTICIVHPNTLSADELADEYEKLSTSHKNLKLYQENDLQQIHELKRVIKISSQNEAYLANEVTELTNVHTNKVEELKQKHQSQMDMFKKTIQELRLQNTSLETNCEEFKKQIIELHKEMENLENVREGDSSASKSFDSRDTREAEFESEKQKMLEQINDLRLELDACKLTEYKLNIEKGNMAEKVQCLENNLQTKKEALQEKEQLLDSANEKMVELKSEIVAFQQTPNNTKKGNSLFAEVDDQRQKMRQILAAQNKQYQQMKKACDEKDLEIRRIKFENESIETQVLECRFMFANADKSYKDRLYDRINLLLQQNEQLKQQKEWTEDKLVEVAAGKEITWIDAMMDYCRKETEELKSKLYNCMLQKSLCEDDLHCVQQELVKWRLEALKSRVTIKNREALLSEGGIYFELANTKYVQPTQQEINSATPCLFADQNENFEGSEKSNFKAKDINLELPKIVLKTQEEINEENDGYKNEIVAKLSKLSSTKPKISIKTVKDLNLECEIVVVADDNNDSEVIEIANLSMKEKEMSYSKQKISFDISLENIDNPYDLSPHPTLPPIPPPSTSVNPKESTCSVANSSIHMATPTYRNIVYTPKQAPAKTFLQPRKILVDNIRTSNLANNKTVPMATEVKKVKFKDNIANSKESIISQNEENNETEKVLRKPSKSNIIVRKIIVPSKPIVLVPNNK